MFTVITKANKVKRVDSVHYGSVDDIIVICEDGYIKINKGNPITWPTNTTNGLQAIVDVKEGTLRFGHDELINLTEYVVREYCESDAHKEFTSIEDAKSGLHSESSTVVWPEGTPDGHIAVRDNINGDIYVVAPDHEFKTNEEKVCVKQTGLKLDSGKPMMGCIPPHAELAVARVLTFGAQKYSRGNWAHVENSDERYMDAALRHINAYRRGENTDSETGESHLAHAACCILFMLDKLEMLSGAELFQKIAEIAYRRPKGTDPTEFSTIIYLNCKNEYK